MHCSLQYIRPSGVPASLNFERGDCIVHTYVIFVSTALSYAFIRPLFKPRNSSFRTSLLLYAQVFSKSGATEIFVFKIVLPFGRLENLLFV